MAMCMVNNVGWLHLLPRLFAVRGSRPGKTVNLTEGEIRAICAKSREILLNQPILLELEAPIKICGVCKAFFHCASSAKHDRARKIQRTRK